MKYLTHIIITFFLISCASLGTNTRFGNSVNPETIKSIGIVTTRGTFPNQYVNTIADSLFLLNLKAELQKSTGREIVYLGESEYFLENSETILSKDSVDAVIQCELYLIEMITIDNSKRFNSHVRTQMFKIRERTFVAETDFNTKLGKSYGRHPLLEVAIRDGVVGAIKPLKKIFVVN